MSAGARRQAAPRRPPPHARHLLALPGAVQQQAVAQGIATPEQKAAAKRHRRFIVTWRPYYPSMAEITEGLGLGWDVRNAAQLERLQEHLQRLRLFKVRERLEALLQDAPAKETPSADFLDLVLTEEDQSPDTDDVP